MVKSPKFQRRHYEVVAKLMRDIDAQNDNIGREMIKRFADEFEADNSRFDRNRFIDACYTNITLEPVK